MSTNLSINHLKKIRFRINWSRTKQTIKRLSSKIEQDFTRIELRWGMVVAKFTVKLLEIKRVTLSISVSIEFRELVTKRKNEPEISTRSILLPKMPTLIKSPNRVEPEQAIKYL